MVEKKSDLGQAEVQKNVDKEQDKGYLGVSSDPTPDEHYTLAGVAAGKPTPETDAKAAAAADAHQAKIASKFGTEQ